MEKPKYKHTGILDPEESLICICFRSSNKEVSESELEPSFLSPMEMEGGEWKILQDQIWELAGKPQFLKALFCLASCDL